LRLNPNQKECKVTDSTLQERIDRCPPALQTIIEEFRDAPPRDRMEYLIEYAMSLPPLPDRYQAQRDNLEQVHECQTPVFLATEIDDNAVHFHLDIPPESPTVRGYAAILVEGLDGATPAAVLATPDDVYMLLGLHEVITPQRVRGLHALLGYMKKQVKNRL
jgi:cysteine desulfuration protein SufE